MNLRLVGMLQITPINLPLLFILVVGEGGLKKSNKLFQSEKSPKKGLQKGGWRVQYRPLASAMIWISRLDGIVKQFTLSGPSKGPTGGC